MQAFVGDVEADRTKNGTPHVGAGVPTAPAAHGNDLITPTANPHTPGRECRPRRSAQQHRTKASRPANPHLPRPVGRADPGAPGSNAHVVPQFRANSQAPPCREGACPFRQGMPRRPPTLGESASVQRIRPGFSMSDRVLSGKGKPFPYNETAADSPGVAACLWRCCGPSGTPAPTMKCCGFAAGGDLSLALLRNRPRAGRRSLQSAAFHASMGTVNAKNRTFVPFVCGFAAWMSF